MIPVLLAGLAGYALVGAAKKRRRRNPEQMFKWKISNAILEELYNFEVENIDISEREGSAKEMALAIEAAGRKGPKTLTLSRAASWDLHDALDNAQDIHADNGLTALARAEGNLRDKIAAALNADPVISPSKKVAGKFIIGVGGKALKGADGATLYFDSEAAAKAHLPKANPLRRGRARAITISANVRELMKAGFKQKQAVAIALKTSRRNPLSIDLIAMPAANMLWRKHGFNSPGWAADLAMMAPKGSSAKKLWLRVTTILKDWLYSGKPRVNPHKRKRKR